MTDAPVFEDILYEKRDTRAAWIIINRPKLYNAFRAQTMEELIRAFQMAGYDKCISSIVLTGAGDKAFCTGGDQSAHEGQYDGRGIVGLPIDEFQSVLRDVPKPVIARVNGFAIGGGNVFATLCDMTIAADTASSARSDRKSVRLTPVGARRCSRATSATSALGRCGISTSTDGTSTHWPVISYFQPW